jgi:NAD(P)-dependent dehydrogenase (short-subunit alcohol dehydrogenase family)
VTAVEAARRGYSVCVNYQKNAARADAVVREIRETGGTAIAVAADVGDKDAIARIFECVDKELGRVTALVNCAGILGPLGRLDLCDASGLDAVFRTNVVGTLLCCREAIRRMSTRYGGAGGVIVNLSSAVSRVGSAGTFVPYGASKAAINSLTFHLAQELADEGIRVNAVSPGIIDTEMLPPGRAAEVSPLVPMKRLGRPEEVAAAILWLLSDEASYICGTVLDVSGGR